ncbi:hypothetical protein I302_100308 [Kwoniella bestiolae CBS 10118]|uniref:Uncharacterized protein n=1 Tax=Kwoniella bestiolae CBS 10118 TaxID=1296100 RepID=A0A1B9G4S1_9TREE|nr:hypothetical protein I302_03680 [Kwoniella bestiolae CBS 10118]OCF26003.1 hypothetical protein I302_03680 [Kwoniella bestiolae CBS 10118]
MSYLVNLSPLSLSTGQIFDARSIHDASSFISGSGSASPGWSSALEQQNSMTDLSTHSYIPLTLHKEFPKVTVSQSTGSSITISVEYPNSTVVDVRLPVAIPNAISSSHQEINLDELYIPSEDPHSTDSTPRPLSLMSSSTATAPSIMSDITQEGDYEQEPATIHQVAHRPQIVEFEPMSYAASLIDPDEQPALDPLEVWNSIISNLSVEDIAKIYTPTEQSETQQPVWLSDTSTNVGTFNHDQALDECDKGLARTSSSVFSDAFSALFSRCSHAFDTLRGYVKRCTSDSRLDYDGLDPYAYDKQCQAQLEGSEQTDTLYSTENLPPVGHLPNGSQVALPKVRRKALAEDRLHDVDNPPPADHPGWSPSSQSMVA